MGILSGIASFVSKAVSAISGFGASISSIEKSNAGALASQLMDRIGVSSTDVWSMASKFGSWAKGLRDSKGAALLKTMIVGGSTDASEAIGNANSLPGLTVTDLTAFKEGSVRATALKSISNDSGEMASNLEDTMNSGSRVTTGMRLAARDYVMDCYKALQEANPNNEIAAASPYGLSVTRANVSEWVLPFTTAFSGSTEAAGVIAAASNLLGATGFVKSYTANTTFDAWLIGSTPYTWSSTVEVDIQLTAALGAATPFAAAAVWSETEPATQAAFGFSTVVQARAAATRVTVPLTIIGSSNASNRLWIWVSATALTAANVSWFQVVSGTFFGRPNSFTISVPASTVNQPVRYIDATGSLTPISGAGDWGDLFGLVNPSTQYVSDPNWSAAALWAEKFGSGFVKFYQLAVMLDSYLTQRPYSLSSGASMTEIMASVLTFPGLTYTQYTQLVALQGALYSTTVWASLQRDQVDLFFGYWAATLSNILDGIEIDDNIVLAINEMSGYAIANS